jgi:hypothetical protein
MRGFVLLLLGGGLVWWIWSGLGSSEAHEPEVDSTEVVSPPVGRMLTPPSRPEAEHEREAEADPVPAAPEPIQTGSSRPPIAAPGTDQGAEVTGRAPIAASGFEDGLAIAECLLHRPHELPQLLASQGDAMSEDRQRLVLALAHAIDGRLGRAYELANGLQDSGDISSAEWDLCRRLIAEDQEVQPISATYGAQAPLLLAAVMGWNAREADQSLKAGKHTEAARAYSDLLLGALGAPWPSDANALRAWMDGLTRAQSRYRWNRDAQWPSLEVTVESGESLVAIRKRVLAQRSDLLLCTGLIAQANELRSAVIHPGDRLRIPTDRAHMLVDLSARTAFYMLGDEVVGAWLVGIGRPGNDTRPGTYTVGDKQEEPMWFRTGQDPVPFGDPENPLGTRWLGWNDDSGRESSLGFHGTNDPGGVGGAVSDGCIRMHNRDVEELFEILPKGARVVVQP